MVSGNRQAERAKETFVALQANLQNSLRNLDPEVTCTEDSWDREEGGGGEVQVKTKAGFRRARCVEADAGRLHLFRQRLQLLLASLNSS